MNMLHIDYDKKKETLKKLYLVNVEQSKHIEQLEMDNVEMKATIDRLNSDNRTFNGTMKHALAERHFLDDRLTEVQSRHTLDLNRLHSTVADKERVSLFGVSF